MAKLVDLLAKYLVEWPKRCEIIVQDEDKECKPCGCLRADLEDGVVWIRDTPIGCNFYLYELASDWDTAKVTYKQWLAARDRLHDETVKDMREPTNADHDQELWDKVASESMSLFGATALITKADVTYSFVAEAACKAADAFMAERAKRLKGGV